MNDKKIFSIEKKIKRLENKKENIQSVINKLFFKTMVLKSKQGLFV